MSNNAANSSTTAQRGDTSQKIGAFLATHKRNFAVFLTLLFLYPLGLLLLWRYSTLARRGRIIASLFFGVVFLSVIAEWKRVRADTPAKARHELAPPAHVEPSQIVESLVRSEADFKEYLDGLYRDLLVFKGDASFRKYGFSEGGQSSWMREAKALADKKIKSVKGRTAAGHLVQLGLQYYATKGTESDLTAFYKRSIHEFLRGSAEIDH